MENKLILWFIIAVAMFIIIALIMIVITFIVRKNNFKKRNDLINKFKQNQIKNETNKI